jgi:hypothetical protein
VCRRGLGSACPRAERAPPLVFSPGWEGPRCLLLRACTAVRFGVVIALRTCRILDEFSDSEEEDDSEMDEHMLAEQEVQREITGQEQLPADASNLSLLFYCCVLSVLVVLSHTMVSCHRCRAIAPPRAPSFSCFSVADRLAFSPETGGGGLSVSLGSHSLRRVLCWWQPLCSCWRPDKCCPCWSPCWRLCTLPWTRPARTLECGKY